MIPLSKQARDELAPRGAIRFAINLANPALVAVAPDDSLSGRCIELALGLGRATDLPVSFVRFASAGQVVAAEQQGDAWDVAFLAFDPARTDRLRFSDPYLSIEATYAVAAGSRIASIGQVDRPGVLIATTSDATYDLYLQRTLRFARRHAFPDPEASFAAFEAGGFDAVAGVRDALSRRYAAQTNVRLLPGAALTIDQAMVVPVARREAGEIVDRYLHGER